MVADNRLYDIYRRLVFRCHRDRGWIEDAGEDHRRQHVVSATRKNSDRLAYPSSTTVSRRCLVTPSGCPDLGLLTFNVNKSLDNCAINIDADLFPALSY